VSLYNNRPRHYRLVNFIGLALSASTLALLAPQPTEDSCPLCTGAQLILLITSTLFLLAWLQNPRRTGQQTYATLNLLLATPILISITLSYWLQHKTPPETCTALFNNGLAHLTHYLPADSSLIRAVHSSQPCQISQQSISGFEPSSILLATFTLLVLISWVQLSRKRQERSLFL